MPPDPALAHLPRLGWRASERADARRVSCGESFGDGVARASEPHNCARVPPVDAPLTSIESGSHA